MKNRISFATHFSLSFFVVLALASVPSLARAEESLNAVKSSPVRALVEEMRELVLRCAVRPYAVQRTGKKVFGYLQSTCSEVQVDVQADVHGVGNRAHFNLEAGYFSVDVTDSIHSDGGDLVDLSIRNSQGQELEVYQDVLGFSDPLQAILGGHAEELKEVFDPSILNRRR